MEEAYFAYFYGCDVDGGFCWTGKLGRVRARLRRRIVRVAGRLLETAEEEYVFYTPPVR